MSKNPRAASTPSKKTTAYSYRNALKAPDPFVIHNQDPNRVYRFLSRRLLSRSSDPNKPGDMGFDPRGYTILTEGNSKGERLGTSRGGYGNGSTLVYEDLVVGFIDKEEYQERVREKDLANKMIQESYIGSFKNAVRDAADRGLEVSYFVKGQDAPLETQVVGRSDFE